MKNILKRSAAFILAALIVVAFSGVNVYAEGDDNVFSEDSSGNWFGAGELVDIASQAIGDISNELFGAGYNVKADGVNVAGSAFLAGNDVSVKGSTIDGSLFIAGRIINIDSAVDNNIWAAGQDVTLGENSSVRGLHIASATATVSGNYEAADIACETVVFDAVVTGDVSINAEHVTIGPNASVDGKITVTSVNEPAVDGSANVKNLTYKQLKSASDEQDEAEANPSSKSSFIKKIKSTILAMIKYAILAMLFLAVFGKNLEKSYEYSKTRPGAHWGFGFLSLIAVPIAAIILCITVIGLPIAGITLTIYVLAIVFSRTFMFASLGRELIFTHTPKRLNPYLEVSLAVMAGVIIKQIPILGSLVGFVGIIYTLGYVTLAITDTISSNKQKKAKEVTVENVTTEA